VIIAPLVLATATAAAPPDDRLQRALTAIGRKVTAIHETPSNLTSPPGLALELKAFEAAPGICERDTLVLVSGLFGGSPEDNPKQVTSRTEFAGSALPPPGKTTGPSPDCDVPAPDLHWLEAASPGDYAQAMRTLDRLAGQQARRDPNLVVSCQSMLALCTEAQRRLTVLAAKAKRVTFSYAGGAESVIASGDDGMVDWQVTARVAPGGAAKAEIVYRRKPLI
jgi:hypothetical protein